MAGAPGPFRPFRWNRKKEDAALLLAENEITQREVAARVGCGLSTLKEWMQHPAFIARVKELEAELEASALRYAFAKKRNRVRELSGLMEKMLTVIRERAADPTIAWEISQNVPDAVLAAAAGEPFRPELRSIIPGIATGLIVRKVVAVKKVNEHGQVRGVELIEEYAVDTALIGRILDTDQTLAKEMGQWVEKTDQTVRQDDAEQVYYYLPEKGSDPSPIAPARTKGKAEE